MGATKVGPASDLKPGTVTGAGTWAAGNAKGDLFAVSRRCRHLYADLAQGSIDGKGCPRVPVARLQVRREVRTGWCAAPKGSSRRYPA